MKIGTISSASMINVLVCVFGSLLTSSGSSMDLDPKAIRGRDRTKPVQVLQNRYFTKTLRPEIGVAVGKVLDEAYTDTSIAALRLALFISENIGFELQHSKAKIEDSDDLKALKKLRYIDIDSQKVVAPTVETNLVTVTTDMAVILAPFYGKLNFFDRFILYSDLYFTAGISQLTTSQGDKTSLSLGAGQRFYWMKSLSFRIDFKNRFFDEVRAGEKIQKNSQSIDFGISYFFL